jgi:hypothetical protein
MRQNRPISTSRVVAKRRALLLALTTLVLLVVACINGDTPTDEPELPSRPTRTTAPARPTVTTAPVRPTTDPNLVLYNNVSGLWSGCPADAGGGLFLDICPEGRGLATGPFITLYLPPTCSIGQACGVYIKGAFQSEFIPFELTLQGFVQGRAEFYADPGGGMYAGLDRTIYLSVIGGQLEVIESTGETYMLSPGCNPVINANFTCMTTMPG